MSALAPRLTTRQAVKRQVCAGYCTVLFKRL